MIREYGLSRLFKILSLSTSGATFGIGHFVRQNILGDYFTNFGWSFTHYTFNEVEGLGKQFQIAEKLGILANVIILDLDPRFVRDNFKLIEEILKSKSFCNKRKVLYDENIEFTLKSKFSEIEFQMALFPYGFLGKSVKGNEYSGFDYSVFSKSLSQVRDNRPLSGSGFLRVLISCGGSDPMSVTTSYLRAIFELSKSELELTVVIGEHFSASQIETIKKFNKSDFRKIQFLYQPSSLSEVYLSSDLALVTGGLTRNETIYVGIPTMVTNIDQNQFESTKMFADKKAVINVGLINSSNRSTIESEMITSLGFLTNNSGHRSQLSQEALRCIPENGAQQLVKEIGALCLI